MTSLELRVEDVMTRRIATARPDESLHEVWFRLGEEHCHHMPVVEAGRVVGMISSRDLVRVANRLGVAKLSAAVDLGMTGEDLLDQRGARARHAEDEYGRAGGRALAAGAGQKLAIEHRHYFLDLRFERAAIVFERRPP